MIFTENNDENTEQGTSFIIYLLEFQLNLHLFSLNINKTILLFYRVMAFHSNQVPFIHTHIFIFHNEKTKNDHV